MMTAARVLAVAAMMFAPLSVAAADTLQDARKAMIAESLRSYSGSCPCPWNNDRAGRSCGKRSAWSRPGGASPLCYASDISDAMARNWLSRNGYTPAAYGRAVPDDRKTVTPHPAGLRGTLQ